MRIKEIENIIQNTCFRFEEYHDFSGIHDRYIVNHDVLISDNYRLAAMNKARTKWRVFKITNEDTPLKKIVENIALEQAVATYGR